MQTEFKRLRRNRLSPALRALLAENSLTPNDLVAPFFVADLEGEDKRPSSLPGIDVHAIPSLLKKAEDLHRKGIQGIILFPVIPQELKDLNASAGLDPNGILPRAIRALKDALPSLCLFSDIALDPFTSHGHDGIIDAKGHVLNDETLEILKQIALLHSEAGVDMVAPSDMMDGRVRMIRQALDLAGHSPVGILSYAAKYASSLYEPYRDTLGSQVRIGDKKSYQLNPGNAREALLEALEDIKEGADILMVKPALLYLDIINKIRESTSLPLCAFHVSGEYAMVMAAHEKGFLDADKVFLESLLSIKRAGADFIISYAVEKALNLLI